MRNELRRKNAIKAVILGRCKNFNRLLRSYNGFEYRGKNFFRIHIEIKTSMGKFQV